MAEMALLKAVEAGVDGIDTAISSMSGTYGHPATESLVATLQGTEYDTGLDIPRLEKIAAYFRNVRKKYAKFEGQLRGVDSRIFQPLKLLVHSRLLTFSLANATKLSPKKRLVF